MSSIDRDLPASARERARETACARDERNPSASLSRPGCASSGRRRRLHRMEAPETRYTKSGDVHIAYQVFGDGGRDLVFLAEFWNSIEAMWEQPDYHRSSNGSDRSRG